MGCSCGNAHSTRLALCRHFTAFAELFSFLFFVVYFQDSLKLEEPVKVLNVGCRFLRAELRVERLTGIKPTLRCSGKSEGETERVFFLLWNKVRYLEGCK